MDLLKFLAEDLLRWESLEEIAHLELDDNGDDDREPATVQSLHRSFYSLYGTHPKMEDRLYSSCRVCEQVFNPQAIAKHREHCLGKDKNPTPKLTKKIKSNKKKIQTPSVPLPPLFKEEETVAATAASMPKAPPAEPQSSRVPEVVPEPPPIATCSKSMPDVSDDNSPTPTPPPPPPPPPLLPPLVQPASPAPAKAEKMDEQQQPSTSNGTAVGGGSSRNRKKLSKSAKEYDPDMHCGVVDGSKGPCTRSITCSNHKIQMRKSVPGRTKDIHELIAEKKAAKEKEAHNQTQNRTRTPPRHIEPKPTFFQIIEDDTTASEVQQIAEVSTATGYPDPVSLENISASNVHDEVDAKIHQLENGYCIPLFDPQKDEEDSLLKYLLKPVNPPVIQKENTIYVKTSPNMEDCPSNAFTKLTIPDDKIKGLKMYDSHPKPHSHSTFGARKIGGSIVCTNHRLEFQRNDIEMAITTKRLTNAATNCKNSTFNSATRSILIKKNINKVNCKRPSTDKLITSDNKQIRLTQDMNGYIIQADMSEVADAPQPNHCIQENINLLNMK